jgi:hypothetical protein
VAQLGDLRQEGSAGGERRQGGGVGRSWRQALRGARVLRGHTRLAGGGGLRRPPRGELPGWGLCPGGSTPYLQPPSPLDTLHRNSERRCKTKRLPDHMPLPRPTQI